MEASFKYFGDLWVHEKLHKKTSSKLLQKKSACMHWADTFFQSQLHLTVTETVQKKTIGYTSKPDHVKNSFASHLITLRNAELNKAHGSFLCNVGSDPLRTFYATWSYNGQIKKTSVFCCSQTSTKLPSLTDGLHYVLGETQICG